MVELGRFFFKWRNALFPVLVFALYLLVRPATQARWLDLLAIALVIVGVLIRATVIGYVLVLRDGDNKVSHADELFTKGMFGICRNPLYLGNITTYIGIFLLHGAWPVLLLGAGLFVFIYYAIIFSEESFLRGKFGQSFADYCARVPRLMPMLGNWSAATKDMTFSFKRAIWVEYNVMTQAILMVALALWYKSWAVSGSATMPMVSIVLLVAGVAFIGTIRVLKARARNNAAK